jgi:hypothetical protein
MSSLMHTWPWAILVLLFRIFGILAPKKIYVFIRVIDFCSCLWDFQIRTVLMMLYIFVFHYFIQDIFIGSPPTTKPGLSSKASYHRTRIINENPKPRFWIINKSTTTPEPRLSTPYSVVGFAFLKWEVIVFLLDICDTIDHHCWNFLFS